MTKAIKDHLGGKLPDFVDISAATVSETRKKAIHLLKMDTKIQKCGRGWCVDKNACFTSRKKQHKEGTTMYHLIKCRTNDGKPVKRNRPKKGDPKKDKKEDNKTTSPPAETITKAITLAGATFSKFFANPPAHTISHTVATAMQFMGPVPSGSTRYLTQPQQAT